MGRLVRPVRYDSRIAAPSDASFFDSAGRGGFTIRDFTADVRIEFATALRATELRVTPQGAGTSAITVATNQPPASTLQQAQAQVEKVITVGASYTDGLVNAESVASPPTPPVRNVNDTPTGELSIGMRAAVGVPLVATSTLADADGLGAILLSAPTEPVGHLIRIGEVFVAGTAEQGQTLTAMDIDLPIGELPHQWYADAVAIDGATGTTLALTQAHVGKRITAAAIWQDDPGGAEYITSDPTEPVRNVNDAPEGTLSISGRTTVGEVLTASSTLADADGIGALAYQWQRDGSDIDGATGESYTLTAGDLSRMITVVARYTDGFGQAELVASAPTARVNPAGTVGLHGVAYQWKSHVLLAGATLAAFDPVATAASSEAFQLRAPRYEAAAGTVSVQVWIDPASPVTGFGFVLTHPDMAISNFRSTPDGAWSLLPHIQLAGQLIVGARLADPAASGVSGPLLVGTVEVQLEPGQLPGPFSFSDVHVGASAVDAFDFRVQPTATDAAGGFHLGVLPGSHEVAASRGTADRSNAVTSADALAALRIAVGINPNPDPDGSGPGRAPALSPYQVIAADVNEDGEVTSADALAVLRMAVRLPAAPPHEWLFVNEAADLWNEAAGGSALTRTSAAWPRALQVQASQDTELNLVGVLRGDVNGSWNAPAGSADLDALRPDYFQQLAARLGVPLDMWGA